jgi:hypothetical protein
MFQFLMRHCQEKQVERSARTFARGVAPLQDQDRFGVLTRPIKRDPQGIEMLRIAGVQRDGSLR